MGIIIGPTTWWANELAVACPAGTALPDGSRIFCKAGGRAWIVAPASTEAYSQWADGKYNNILVGDKCCISEWNTLCTKLISCGFNPFDWFVPSISQLTSGYNCRTFWDVMPAGAAAGNCRIYSSSTEQSAGDVCCLSAFQGIGATGSTKCCIIAVRSMRCVTY